MSQHRATRPISAPGALASPLAILLQLAILLLGGILLFALLHMISSCRPLTPGESRLVENIVVRVADEVCREAERDSSEDTGAFVEVLCEIKDVVGEDGKPKLARVMLPRSQWLAIKRASSRDGGAGDRDGS